MKSDKILKVSAYVSAASFSTISGRGESIDAKATYVVGGWEVKILI